MVNGQHTRIRTIGELWYKRIEIFTLLLRGCPNNTLVDSIYKVMDRS